MIRPRKALELWSWRVVEHRVTKQNAVVPMTSSVTQATATFGAAAVAAEVMPKPRAAKSRYGRLGWWTSPTAREPRTAPTLSMVVSSPYVPPVPWNVSLANTGKHHGEVEGQEADDQHHEKREPELLAPGRVPQSLLDALASRRSGSARVAGPDDEEGGDHGQVGQCIQPETDRRAHGHDQHAGQRRADDAGAVDHHPVEADCARQVVGRDQAAHQGLAGRRVGDLDDSPRHADGDERRHAGLARRSERPQQRRKQAVERLGDHEQLAQVDPIGHRPTPGSEQQGRDPPGRQHQTKIAG